MSVYSNLTHALTRSATTAGESQPLLSASFYLEILDDSFVAEDLKLFNDDSFNVCCRVGGVGVNHLDHATVASA